MAARLNDREILELKYLARQNKPIWGGVIKRGADDPKLRNWEESGLIRRVLRPEPGFLITEKGKALTGMYIHCPNCGHLMPHKEHPHET